MERTGGNTKLLATERKKNNWPLNEKRYNLESQYTERR